MLSAKTSSFAKSMESAAKLTEKTAKTIKRHAAEIGRVGALMGAGIAAALAVAAQHNAAVAAELQNQKNAWSQVATEIAQGMLPALREFTAIVNQALGWWQGLGGETKSQIAHWVGIATAVGLVAIVLAKVAGVVATVASVIGTLSGVVAGVSFAPLLLMLTAVAVAVALVHMAWRQNWSGIQEKTATVINALAGYWGSFKNWLSTSFFDWFINRWADIETAIRRTQNFLKHPFDSGARKSLNDAGDREMGDWKKSMKGGAIGESLKLAVATLTDAGGQVVSEWKLMADEVGDAFKKAIGFTGAAGHVTNTAASMLKTHASNGGVMADAHVQAYYEDLYGKESAESLTRNTKLGDTDEQGFTSSGVAEAYRKEIETRTYWNEQLAGVGQVLASVANSVTSKLGDLGQVINSAVQGFQSGGWIGAIVAVIMELFSRFEGFTEILDLANGQIKAIVSELGSGFSKLVEGFKDFMGASGAISDVVTQILNPILKIIAKVLTAVSPLLETFATAISGLVPIFDLLETILGPIIDAIGYVLRFVGLTILGTVNGLLMLWQGILELVRDIVKIFSPTEAEKITQAMADNWKKITDVQNQMKNLFETGKTGLGDANLRAADSMNKVADAADRAAEELTNMPQGFKVALAQLAATQAVTTSTGDFGSIKREMEREAFRYTGNGTKFGR